MNRRIVSLLVASSFIVLGLTGILAFVRPFSIQIVGLHALMGFVFVGLIALHVFNNSGHLLRYLRSKVLWVTVGGTLALTALFLWQPVPVRAILGLSKNLGPALDRFEMRGDGLDFHYSPASHYKMRLTVKGGPAFDPDNPPPVAIWLENASFYHIKTLYKPPAADASALPFWDFKVRGWEKAKLESQDSVRDLADELGVDAISSATRNSSFDPADYILPGDPDNPMPYRLVIEVDQPDDGLPSLVYAVEIDNADPRTFQLLELVGYPKREEGGEEGWELYYIDERFESALDLIDSALLRIDRSSETQ